MPKSLARVRPAGTLLWLGFNRVQSNRWFSRASIVESMHCMVLRRPVELATQTGQVKCDQIHFSGNATSRQLTRNRWVGLRERSPHESFSLVSPYSSVSKPRADSPLIMGKGIPVPGRERNSEPALLFRGG